MSSPRTVPRAPSARSRLDALSSQSTAQRRRALRKWLRKNPPDGSVAALHLASLGTAADQSRVRHAAERRGRGSERVFALADKLLMARFGSRPGAWTMVEPAALVRRPRRGGALVRSAFEVADVAPELLASVARRDAPAIALATHGAVGLRCQGVTDWILAPTRSLQPPARGGVLAGALFRRTHTETYRLDAFVFWVRRGQRQQLQAFTLGGHSMMAGDVVARGDDHEFRLSAARAFHRQGIELRGAIVRGQLQRVRGFVVAVPPAHGPPLGGGTEPP